MFNTAFEEIDKGRIEAFVADEAREKLALEYKEALPPGCLQGVRLKKELIEATAVDKETRQAPTVVASAAF